VMRLKRESLLRLMARNFLKKPALGAKNLEIFEAGEKQI
jgi:hypothetical protein